MTRHWKLLASLVTIATLSGCAQPPRVAPAPRGTAVLPETLRVQVREGHDLVVREVPLEQYVAATVLSEFDPSSGDERTIERMFEVQAIVSRSYAVAERGRHAREGFDLCSTSHCQVYEPARLRTSRWAELARRAVEHTRGQILLYDGKAAEALFHADCGGHTSSAAAVWGGTPLPYLVGGRDAAAHPRNDWTFEADASAVREALDGDSRTNVGGNLRAIEVTRRDSAGRAETITLKGGRTVVVRGEVFREVMARRFGAKSIRSTLFSVSHSRKFAFHGTGFGHGVGLCQDGALARLAAGATPEVVLAHYFPGTSLSQGIRPTPE